MIIGGSEMKRFMDWLKSGKTEGEHSDVSPSSPIDIDQADSSIFDTGSLNIEKSEDRNAVSQKMLSPQGGSSRSAEEGIGVDPYNTGSFDAKNK
jgi:hypothetical protein